MMRTEKMRNMHLGKRWIMIIGFFLTIQFIFFVIDGTFLEPNINDSGNLFARVARWILDLKLFTEWIAPYSFPFFNLFMTIHLFAILMQAVHDMKQVQNIQKRD